MTCKRVSTRAREEQDYYLRHDGQARPPTEEERLEFLRYDSHGGDITWSNPIYVAKSHYGISVNLLKDSYLSDGWPGGLCVVDEILRTTGDLRFVVEALGERVVSGWLEIWAWHWHLAHGETS